SLIAVGPQSLPSCLWSLRIFPSLHGSRLTIFYRDASSVLLQLVNQWLNFALIYSGLRVAAPPAPQIVRVRPTHFQEKVSKSSLHISRQTHSDSLASESARSHTRL
ncbi:unnamed protein product, partial [Ascophyllum nodosum]